MKKQFEKLTEITDLETYNKVMAYLDETERYATQNGYLINPEADNEYTRELGRIGTMTADYESIYMEFKHLKVENPLFISEVFVRHINAPQKGRIIFSGEAFESDESECLQGLEACKSEAEYFFERLKQDFVKTYPNLSSVHYKDELTFINDFISQAETPHKRKAAFTLINGTWINETKNEEFEYLRLKYGYYETYLIPGAFNAISREVYAKYFLFKDWLENELQSNESGTNPQCLEAKVNTEEKLHTPKAFAEIMHLPELLNDCLQLLRETDKPCINEKNRFIRNKGAFVVWFNTMEAKGMFNCRFSKDVTRAATLNHNFTDLNISESIFRQPNKRAKDNFQRDFEHSISALKL